jgi:hypothetical protein
VGFFTRSGRYNRWGLEELIGRHPDSLFGLRLREVGLDPVAVYALPAVGRLLALWRVAHEAVEREGPRLFGDRFVSVAFEEFCREPQRTVGRIYAAAGSQAPALELSRIRPAKGAYRPRDPRWRPLFERIGLAERWRPDADATRSER